MAQKEKVVVLNKPETRRKILVGVIIALVVIIPFVYWKGWSRLQTAFDQIMVERTVKNFYRDFAEQINTNEAWEDFIEKYLSKSAETLMTGRASRLVYDAEHGSQHVFKFTSPVETKVYKLEDLMAYVLADAAYEESLIGGQPYDFVMEKFLTLEKINNEWKITADADRTASFNEYIESLN